MQNMSDQRWLMQCRWIMWNDTSEISLRIETNANNNEKKLITNCQHYQIPRCQIRSCQTLRLTCFILPKKIVIFQKKK
jgi:hypothetical protein